ncbi:photosystem II protein Y [Cylindrospermopsis raciborskii S07]|jgi:photosystem II PsbY protein|uniref:Photosystem II reaction center protein Y n=5 Tax=Cylindrospermopsis TaxID=77021 RepID=A0A7H0EXB3_9CYAN|nr:MULTISPECIES: photosystem II protein Y [Cylindrospermopsis]MBU6344044.1 photosystem II protein Y [Cyanobacteria bacterium REEB494]BAZ89023.1 photosystem II protein PsbY [Raphidiopsis curvata NIES-932]EFA70933.1 Photosystem II protein PsbY [Cylindrospermopsis raciborskii CS-505]KRH98189.1 photosystem II protein [Cylindrospermopsis sp. CR12]MBA4444460.1 photosystem II protein Y [Cylindrospermopsis raciborskii CS-506_C]
MNIDTRIVIVLAPLVIAASWAAFNIGAAALRQVQAFLNKEA